MTVPRNGSRRPASDFDPSTALLSDLRRRIATGPQPEGGSGRAMPLGDPRLDAALGGGLPSVGLHEICGFAPRDATTAAGFTLTLLTRLLACKDGLVLWVEQDFAGIEAGRLYGPGLGGLGFDPGRLLLASVQRPAEALWAMEEGLRCQALLAVAGELWDAPRTLDLTATRRLSLAARARGAMALVLHHGNDPGPSAALTRWRVRAHAASPLIDDRGLGHPAFEVALMRNRLGPCGAWTVEWDPHERVFRSAAPPVRLAAASPDRPARAAGDGLARRAG